MGAQGICQAGHRRLPAADPAQVEGGGAYGSAPKAKRLARIVGHDPCLDRFGAIVWKRW